MDGLVRPYQLSEDVHVAVFPDGTAIFLDVCSDRYLGVEAARVGCLGRVVAGWPVLGVGEGDFACADGVAPDTVSELMEQGLIREAVAGYKRTELAELPRAQRTLLSPYGDGIATISAGTAWWFLRAWLATEVTLKRGSLRFAIRRLRSISIRGAREPSATDEPRLMELVASFRRLRAAFYTARMECLFNSAALYRYLSARGFKATFVIGVALRPFRAHCWLQRDDLVFDDEPEYIQQFIPILTV